MIIPEWNKLKAGDFIQHKESKYIFEVIRPISSASLVYGIQAKPIKYYTMPGTRAIEVSPETIYDLQDYNQYNIYIKPEFNRLDIIE